MEVSLNIARLDSICLQARVKVKSRTVGAWQQGGRKDCDTFQTSANECKHADKDGAGVAASEERAL